MARIRLTEQEIADFETELPSIIGYVSAVQELVGDAADSAPAVGVRHNVFRADEVTNEPNEYTEAMMAEMPKTHGRYLEVKKILNTDD